MTKNQEFFPVTMPQQESPFFDLPGELRNEIYTLSLRLSAPTVNPSWNPTSLPKYHETPNSSVALLRTCRAIYQEVDSSILIEDNDFVFTRIAYIRDFFSRMTRAQRGLVTRLTIDLREAASGDIASQNEKGLRIKDEWLHYLGCTYGAHPMGAWCSELSTLKSDLPDVESLCIDLTGWQSKFAATRRNDWKYLQSLLRRIRGLKAFTLKGKCLDSSFWNPKPVPWGLGPWFSPAYSKDESALVDLIGKVVREEQGNEIKIFEWQVVDGITCLTVRICRDALQNGIAYSNLARAFSESGTMLWQEFQFFKGGQSPSVEERKMSMSAGGFASAVVSEIVA